MSQLIEDVLPPIQSAGLNTNKNTTLGGNLSVTGTSTFTGVATFTAAPVFSSGRLLNVVSETAAASLTVAQSGSTVLFNSTTGLRVTLPAPTVGTVYEFVVAQTPAAGTHGILTNSGSVFLAGDLAISVAAGTVGTFAANGTSIVGIGMSGTTTGGILGSNFRVVAISSTVWMVTGLLSGSGITATPFL